MIVRQVELWVLLHRQFLNLTLQQLLLLLQLLLWYYDMLLLRHDMGRLVAAADTLRSPDALEIKVIWISGHESSRRAPSIQHVVWTVFRFRHLFLFLSGTQKEIVAVGYLIVVLFKRIGSRILLVDRVWCKAALARVVKLLRTRVVLSSAHRQLPLQIRDLFLIFIFSHLEILLLLCDLRLKLAQLRYFIVLDIYLSHKIFIGSWHRLFGFQIPYFCQLGFILLFQEVNCDLFLGLAFVWVDSLVGCILLGNHTKILIGARAHVGFFQSVELSLQNSIWFNRFLNLKFLLFEFLLRFCQFFATFEEPFVLLLKLINCKC